MKAAVIQLVSGIDVDGNLQASRRLIKQAASQGAELVVLPENFASMEKVDNDKLDIMESLGKGKIQSFLSDISREFSIWIVAGTIPTKSRVDEKVYASSLLYDSLGNCVAVYNKIYLFDVQIPGTTEKYLESEFTLAGTEIITHDTPLGKIGLSVCYDIRFPELYRKLLESGVALIAVPSAFTKRTGNAHWKLLLRARAVENSCFVLAANQGGLHENGRETFGHSMIIDPWGEVLAQVKTGEGYAIAEIDLEHQKKIRENFPAISHRKRL